MLSYKTKKLFQTKRTRKLNRLRMLHRWVSLLFHTYGEGTQEFIDKVAEEYNSTKYFWMKKL